MLYTVTIVSLIPYDAQRNMYNLGLMHFGTLQSITVHNVYVYLYVYIEIYGITSIPSQPEVGVINSLRPSDTYMEQTSIIS